MRTPLWMLIGLAACDLVESPDTSAFLDEIGIGNCEDQPFLCSNSPGYLHAGLHELSLNNLPNTANIRIAQSTTGRPILRKGGFPYELVVVNGEIRGRHPNGGVDLVGGDVAGAEILLVDATTNVRQYDLYIKSHRKVPYPLPPSGNLHLYVMWWHLPDYPADAKLTACNPTKFPRGHDFGGMNPGELLVLDRERLYLPGNPVAPWFSVEHLAANAAGWITFGCGGHAIAKLDLAGSTRRRGTLDPRATQAMLKLYVGDFCGDGFPWTVTGTPLVWKSATIDYAATPSSLEARWTEVGATCIHNARLDLHPDPSIPPDPGSTIKQMIQGSCQRPIHDCVNTDWTQLDGAKRVSGNRL